MTSWNPSGRFCVGEINRELSLSRGHHPDLCAEFLVRQSFQLDAILAFVNLERRDAFCSICAISW